MNQIGNIENLKVPPNSIEAEQSVIGALLLDNSALDKIADLVSNDDFYRRDHQVIFRHIVTTINAQKPADVITVFESLAAAHEADSVGGLQYLNLIAQNTPSAANVRRYAEIVRERAVLRRILTAVDEIAGSVFNPNGRSAMQILDEAEAKILAIAKTSAKPSQGFVKLQPLLMQAIERVDSLYNQPEHGEVTGISTGIVDLDLMTSGLQPGDLIIVAGRPSMGKTTLAINIGEHVAIEKNLPVAVFSMEMGGAQLAMRMLGSVGSVDQHRLRTGKLGDEDWPLLTEAITKMGDAPFYIDETSALSSFELSARARRLAHEVGGLGMLIVDYLQLMSGASPDSRNGGRKSENRTAEVSEISRSLKWLAKELNCPVVALSQLNRSLESRPNKRPVMSDLRESGAIEQDADLILFIYRDVVYNPDSPDQDIAEIIVGKHRNGPIGTVRAKFQGKYTRFENA